MMTRCVCVGCVVSVEGSMLEARVFQLESRKISSKFCNFVSLANPHSWQFIQTWVYLLSASVNVLNFSARRNKFAPPKHNITNLSSPTVIRTIVRNLLFPAEYRHLFIRFFLKIPSTRNPYFFTEIQYSKPL